MWLFDFESVDFLKHNGLFKSEEAAVCQDTEKAYMILNWIWLAVSFKESSLLKTKQKKLNGILS